MLYVNHRINTIEQLKDVPIDNGIEFDVRYHENELILHHDPFNHQNNNDDTFEDLLKQWGDRTGAMIVNVKTEGVEMACIELLNKYQVKNWFFLDLSMPYFCIYANKAINNEIPGFSPENLAVRFSEYEPIEYVLSFTGKAKWVWVDCFTYLPLDDQSYQQLKDAGYKICITSPELQKHSPERIAEFRKQLEPYVVDAICTKHEDLWTK